MTYNWIDLLGHKPTAQYLALHLYIAENAYALQLTCVDIELGPLVS